MDPLAQSWSWIAAHPAETGWIIFGALSALVGIYRLNEAKIKARVARTSTKADDKFVSALDGLVAVFEIARLFAPYGIAKPRRPRKEDLDA